MSVFTWKPTGSADLTIKPTILRAQFGDGYEQRVGDGVNLAPRSWSVTFTGYQSVIDAIEAFLVGTQYGVQSFTWTPPRGAEGKFVVDGGWTRQAQPFVDTLTATFREVFEP